MLKQLMLRDIQTYLTKYFHNLLKAPKDVSRGHYKLQMNQKEQAKSKKHKKYLLYPIIEQSNISWADTEKENTLVLKTVKQNKLQFDLIILVKNLVVRFHQGIHLLLLAIHFTMLIDPQALIFLFQSHYEAMHDKLLRNFQTWFLLLSSGQDYTKTFNFMAISHSVQVQSIFRKVLQYLLIEIQLHYNIFNQTRNYYKIDKSILHKIQPMEPPLLHVHKKELFEKQKYFALLYFFHLDLIPSYEVNKVHLYRFHQLYIEDILFHCQIDRQWDQQLLQCHFSVEELLYLYMDLQGFKKKQLQCINDLQYQLQYNKVDNIGLLYEFKEPRNLCLPRQVYLKMPILFESSQKDLYSAKQGNNVHPSLLQ